MSSLTDGFLCLNDAAYLACQLPVVSPCDRGGLHSLLGNWKLKLTFWACFIIHLSRGPGSLGVRGV